MCPRLRSALAVAFLAQLSLGHDEDGLALLVVVHGVAREAGQPCLGMRLAQVGGMTRAAPLLDSFRGCPRKTQDLFWITARIHVRRPRSVASFAALQVGLPVLERQDMK
jgi:hypothetical protein